MSQEKVSLEAAAKEYMLHPDQAGTAHWPSTALNQNAFIAGAKFREAQLLEIVNEMKAALEDSVEVMQELKGIQPMSIVNKYDKVKNTLTSVNKALDEMGLL